jgi:L-lactate dehydrogenase complex protein LldG
MSERQAPGLDAGLRAFLDALSRSLPPPADGTPLPDEPLAELSEVEPDGDLAARFCEMAMAAGCQLHEAAQSDWAGVVLEVIRGVSGKRVLLEPQAGTALPGEQAEALRRVLEAAGVTVVRERDDAAMFSVDAAITGVRAAVAETGTLVCLSGAASARGATLIPPVHVAVVSRGQLVADLFDGFGWLQAQGGIPATVTFITGPSKTADIEGILVTGVHGPGAVHVVLVD